MAGRQPRLRGAAGGLAGRLLPLPLLLPSLASACTQVLVPAPDGEVVVANTVESGDFVELHGGKTVRPTLRGEHLGGGRGAACGGDCGLGAGRCSEFEAKLGFVGSMNERGLVVSHHLLKLSVYEEPSSTGPNICARDVEQWILGSFASVAELRASLRQATGRPRVVADPEGAEEPTALSWGVVDASGAAAVLEFVKGAARLHNNTVGVLTNDPTWDWHVANLNNYAALQPNWYATNNAGMEVPVSDEWYPWQTNAYDANPPAVPAPIGHGFNLLGLPGDGSGASRFVRVFFQRAYALRASPPRDLEGALILGQELLNTIYKVKGSIPGRDARDPLETTPLATLAVPAAREVYHRGRADLTWRKIDLKRVDFSPAAVKRHARVAAARFNAIDVTGFLTGEEHAEEGELAV